MPNTIQKGSEKTFKNEYLNEPFTDHNWREKPCGCKQLYVEGFWETKYRCETHQKIVDKSYLRKTL